MQKRLIFLNVTAYICLVIGNILARKLPFFGKTAGDVSDLYPRLLTPADFTFKIWILIYVLLGVFIYAQVMSLFKKPVIVPAEVTSISFLFAFSSIINILTLVMWQSQQIGWAFTCIFSLWVVLIIIYNKLFNVDGAGWMYTLPISVYLGWICISTLTTLNVLLTQINFNFFGYSEECWTSFIVGVGICGTLLVLYLNKDVCFTLVIMWAFYGVYAKNKLLTIEANWVECMTLFAITFLGIIGLLVGLNNRKLKMSRL